MPALRSEFSGFERFLESKLAEGKESIQYEGKARRDMAQMLDSQSALAIKWEVSQTSGWFKERLLSDMKDEQSLLRLCLREGGTVIPAGLVSRIGDFPRLSRQDVYVSAKETGNKNLWHILCEYTDFLYYLSGARAVCSEGLLPQENLIDFSLSDLANGRTRLSDAEVFFKIFVDLIKTTTHTHFPLDMLDALTINDVLDLHSVAVEDRFVDKYNAIQEKTKSGLTIHDPERLVLVMEELEELERQLHIEYNVALKKELPRHLRNHKKAKAAKFLNATASLFVSPWGIATGAKDIVVSGLELVGMGEITSATQNRIQQRLKACSRLIDRAKDESTPVLLTFMERMQERYAEKILKG